jgi:hypothetical protein
VPLFLFVLVMFVIVQGVRAVSDWWLSFWVERTLDWDGNHLFVVESFYLLLN